MSHGKLCIRLATYQSHDTAVRNRDTLGLARRAGRVHDVGWVLCPACRIWITGRTHVPNRRVLMKIERLEASSGQADRQRSLGDHDAGIAVLQHEPQTVDWVVAGQRYIDAAGFENRQHADNEFEGAIQVDRDRFPFHRSKLPQAASYLVGAMVQLPVRQMHVVRNDSDRVGCAFHLLFEQLVYALVPWIIPCRPVPIHEQLLTLGGRQQIHSSDRLSGIGHEPAQEFLPVRGHPSGRRFAEQVAGVLEFTRPRIPFGRDTQDQVVFAGACVDVECLPAADPSRQGATPSSSNTNMTW